MSRPAPVTAVAAGFAIGAVSHAIDFVRYGAWPYAFGGPAFDLFWNTLLPLDVIVVALTVGRWPRAGLALAVIVMSADIVANAYAWQVLGIDAFAEAVPIQGAFGVFVAWVAWRYRAGVPRATGWSSRSA